jgi:hypothetical protein
VEGVELAEEPLDGRAAEPAPRGPDGMGRRQPPGPELDVDRGECRPDPLRAADARGRERDDLVLARGGLDQPAERALHVVPDAEQVVAQRADVERDPHDVGL